MNQGLKSQDRQFKKTATHNTDFVGSKLFGSALVVRYITIQATVGIVFMLR